MRSTKLMIAALSVSSFSTCYAQLSQEQKVTDFLALAGLYNRNYAPYDWKLKAFGFDMLKLQPWLAQVNAAHTDLDFYDVCVRYVATLHDYPSGVTVPS